MPILSIIAAQIGQRRAFFKKAEIIIVSAVFLLNMLLIVLWRDNRVMQIALSDIGSVIELAPLSIYLAVVAYHMRKISGRLRWAWGCVSVACALTLLANIFQTYFDLVRPIPFFQTLFTVLFIVAYPVFLGSLFLFPAYAVTRLERVKLILDSIIVMIAATLIVLIYLIEPVYGSSQQTTLDLLALLAQPVVDLAMICVAVATLASKPHLRLRTPLRLIVIAIVGLAAGDVLYNFQSQITWMNTPVAYNVIFLCCLMCLALAAIVQMEMVSKANTTGKLSIQFDTVAPTSQSVHFVYTLVTIGCVAVLLFGWLNSAFVAAYYVDHVVEIGLTVLFLMILSRQALSTYEAGRLSVQQANILAMSSIFAASRDFADLQRTILRQLEQIIQFKAAALFLLDTHDKVSFVRYAPETAQLPTLLIPRTELPPDSLQGNKPYLLFEVQNGPYLKLIQLMDSTFNEGQAQAYSALVVPLKVLNETIGLILVYSDRADQYDDWHQRVASALASQAAAAIENIQLRTKAVNAATAAERSKLARDLHDSVSQALFGIVMGANSALVLSDKNPSGVKATVQYILSLADGALSEMKALIFELRPDILMKEGLISALQRQTDVLCRRHGIETKLYAQIGEPLVAPEVKEALYRIALEAVQNTIKHAGAKQVHINLYQNQINPGLILDIKDDGKGFDPHAQFAGHLGLVSIRERAANIGGVVEISSQPNQGTLVRVILEKD